MPKNAQTTTQIALISHGSKVVLKILQARIHQYVNCELPDVHTDFAGSWSGGLVFPSLEEFSSLL